MAAPNNPISGLLGPLSDYADKQAEMGQASKMLMGKYMLDQNTASATRRFETLNANIKGFEERRKDLESHKWNMLNALIDPQGDAFQGQQRSAILKQLGFDENTYQVMLGSLNTDLRSIDRVLQSNYQLRNEAYGFGRNQGVYNTYAGGGGAGGGAQTGEEAFLKSLQQGGAPAPVTQAADATGPEQGGQGWMADVGEMAQLTGGSIRDLAVGYWKFANDTNNWVNKLYEEKYLDPTDKRNWANQVYEKALKLLPGDATPEQIQQFWLAPGLHERLVEVIKAGESDKKSLDLWITENIVEGFDPYFKKFGLVLDDFGITDAANKAVDVGGQLLDDARRYWFPGDAEIGGPATASPPAAAPSAETPSAIVPPTPFSPESPDLRRYPMESTPTPTPSGNISGVPSPDVFGTGQVPSPPPGVTDTTTPPEIPNRMAVWQEYVTSIGLPWDPRAVPPGGTPWSSMATELYKKNIQNLFYEGSQMGGAPTLPITQEPTPMASDEWYIDSEISVVPTYEVFQQRIQGTPGDPGFYGAPVANTQQQVSVAQGTPGDPNLQGNVGLDTSVTSPLFQDPMGGGVGQPTMNQQVAPMASTGGPEGVMSGIEEGAMNPFITPGQPQGSVGPQPDPYVPPSLDGRSPPASYPSMGFGAADMDTWYQPAMDIGGPSGDPFTRDDALVEGDVGGPGRMILTPDERRDELKRLASRAVSFTGETWNDFIDWGIDQADPTTIAAIAGAGGGSYFLGKTIRNRAFDAYNKSVADYNKIRAKGTPARTTITQAAADVKELDNMEKVLKKDGRSLSKKDQDKLDDARDNLRNKKSIAWKDFMKKQAKRASWIGLGGAVIYGLSTEAFGMDNVDRQIGLVLDDNKKAQFALDAILKVNPISPVLEMHQQGKQSIPTLRKERHSGPETHKAPGMLGAPGGMILNYPESAFPRSGLNSRAPQVQAMMSELEKKNQ